MFMRGSQNVITKRTSSSQEHVFTTVSGLHYFRKNSFYTLFNSIQVTSTRGRYLSTSSQNYKPKYMVLAQTKRMALERSLISSKIKASVDVMAVCAVFDLLREYGVPEMNIKYICRYHWGTLIRLAQLPNSKDVHSIIHILKKAGASGYRISIPYLLTHHIDILTWRPIDVECCLEEAVASGVSLREFPSVLTAVGLGKRNEEISNNISDEVNIQTLLRDSEMGSEIRVPLSKCIKLDSRFKALGITLTNDRDTSSINDVIIREHPGLDRRLDIGEINQIVYLAQVFYQCGVQSNELLSEIWPIFEQMDFINDIFPRIQFMKSRKLIRTDVPIKQLLLLKQSEFTERSEFGSSGYLQFHLMKKRLGYLAVEKILQDRSFTSGYVVGGATRQTNASKELLLRLLTPEQLSTLLEKLSSLYLAEPSFAHTIRWNLVGRLNYSITDILLELPRLRALCEDVIRGRTKKLESLQKQITQRTEEPLISLHDFLKPDNEQEFDDLLRNWGSRLTQCEREKSMKVGPANISSPLTVSRPIEPSTDDNNAALPSDSIEALEKLNSDSTVNQGNDKCGSDNEIIHSKHIHSQDVESKEHLEKNRDMAIKATAGITKNGFPESTITNKASHYGENQLLSSHKTDSNSSHFLQKSFSQLSGLFKNATQNLSQIVQSVTHAETKAEGFSTLVATQSVIEPDIMKSLVRDTSTNTDVNLLRNDSTCYLSSRVSPTAQQYWPSLPIQRVSYDDGLNATSQEQPIVSENKVQINNGSSTDSSHVELENSSSNNLHRISKTLNLTTEEVEYLEFYLNDKPIISLEDYETYINRYVLALVPKSCPSNILVSYLLYHIPDIIQHPPNLHLYQRIETLLNEGIIRCLKKREIKDVRVLKMYDWLRSKVDNRTGNIYSNNIYEEQKCHDTNYAKQVDKETRKNRKKLERSRWIAHCASTSILGCDHKKSTVEQWIRLSDIQFEITLRRYREKAKKLIHENVTGDTSTKNFKLQFIGATTKFEA